MNVSGCLHVVRKYGLQIYGILPDITFSYPFFLGLNNKIMSQSKLYLAFYTRFMRLLL